MVNLVIFGLVLYGTYFRAKFWAFILKNDTIIAVGTKEDTSSNILYYVLVYLIISSTRTRIMSFVRNELEGQDEVKLSTTKNIPLKLDLYNHLKKWKQLNNRSTCHEMMAGPI